MCVVKRPIYSCPSSHENRRVYTATSASAAIHGIVSPIHCEATARPLGACQGVVSQVTALDSASLAAKIAAATRQHGILPVLCQLSPPFPLPLLPFFPLVSRHCRGLLLESQDTDSRMRPVFRAPEMSAKLLHSQGPARKDYRRKLVGSAVSLQLPQVNGAPPAPLHTVFVHHHDHIL